MKFGIPVVISNPARPRFKTGEIDFAVNKDYISFDWQGDLWAIISKGKSGKREKPASNTSWKSLTQADSVLPTNFLTNTEQRESWRRSERYWRRSRFRCLPISSTESWCRLDRSLKRKIPAAATHRPPQSNSGWLATPPAAQLTRPQPATDGRRTSSPAPHQGPVLLCSRCRRPRHVIPQVLAADCSQSQQKEIRKRNL